MRMTVGEWIGVLTNPRQRDTDGRIARGAADHLKTPQAPHSLVSMGILPTGEKYKIDGHTRSRMWEKNLVERPPVLDVDVYHCDTLEEIMALYDFADNQRVSKGSKDRLYGALRETALLSQLTSSLMRNVRYASALQLAYAVISGNRDTRTNKKKVDLSVAVDEFYSEILLLDSAGPTAGRFPSGIIAGALLALRRHNKNPAKVVEFLRLHQEDRGIKAEGFKDTVFALEISRQKIRGDGGGPVFKMCTRTLEAVEGFLIGKTYKPKYGLKGLDPWKYIAGQNVEVEETIEEYPETAAVDSLEDSPLI